MSSPVNRAGQTAFNWILWGRNSDPNWMFDFSFKGYEQILTSFIATSNCPINNVPNKIGHKKLENTAMTIRQSQIATKAADNPTSTQHVSLRPSSQFVPISAGRFVSFPQKRPGFDANISNPWSPFLMYLTGFGDKRIGKDLFGVSLLFVSCLT